MVASKQTFKDKWETLTPKRKQQSVFAIAIVGVLLISYVLVQGTPTTTHRQGSGMVANDLLPKDAAESSGMSGLSRDVESLRVQSRAKDDKLAKMQASIERLSRKVGGGTAGSPEAREEQRAQLDSLQNEIVALRDERGTTSSGSGASDATSRPVFSGTTGASSSDRPSSNQQASGNVAGSATGTGADGSSAGAGAQGSGEGTAAPAPARAFGTIRTVSAPVPPETQASGPKGESEVPTVYLPSGSILTGVAITGLDAATGKGALQDPVPMLIRIKHDAILPNRYKSDIKECFLLAAGHGDLASERAYMRAESISCIRTDKRVIDIKIQAYAVGPDGKAGVRGRLVSKQGQLIAKAALSGLAQGFSQAFSRNGMGFSRSNNVDYGVALQQGSAQGVGSAFDRIAEYYLDLADQMFPVIEIDAGQKISFVLVRGTSMGVLR